MESLISRGTQAEGRLCELEEKVKKMDQLNKDKERIKRRCQWELQEKKHHTEKPRLWIASIEEEGEFSSKGTENTPSPEEL